VEVMKARNRRVYYVSMGCFKNLYDTEDLSGFLAEAGVFPVDDPREADVILVNTCAFIKSAVKESEDAVRDVCAEAPDVPCIVTGCLVKRHGEKIFSRLPQVRALVSFEHYGEIAEVVDRVLAGERVCRIGEGYDIPWWHPRRFRMTPGSYAYLKISEGCNRCCTFCTIPSLRGPYRSQPVEALVKRALTLALYGVREIILISQDSSRYGIDLYGKPSLDALLRELVRIEELEWIRVLYLYPGKTLREDLVPLMCGEEKICTYFDVPLQHVSPSVLARMGRKGSPEEYAALVEEIRKHAPEAAIRTTFMTGFPGETEEEFRMLCSFVESMKLDHVGCFVYSSEQGTPAASLPGRVDRKTARERRNTLMRLEKEIVREKNAGRVGRVYRVAVDGISREEVSVGHAEFQSPEVDGLVIWKEKSDPGSFVDVEITGYRDYDLVGRLAGEG